MQHDDKTANPFNEYTKRLKAISGKRKKTDEDYMELAAIEWAASLYHTPNKGYFIKAECFEGTFLAAAKAFKQGTIFQQSVRIPIDPVFRFKHDKLIPDELYKLDEYKDLRNVKINKVKILRCRPIFNEWSTEIEIWYDEERLNEADIINFAEYGGRYIGVCDYRPKYGRFSVKVLD